MIEIINKPINDLFYKLVSDSKKTIRICAPYVKQDIVNNIYLNKRKSVKIDFVSNFSIPNFYKRSSDIEAFKSAIKWKDKVYNCQKLHAKFYIFDDKYSIITSSNLTTSGFKKNLEYGILIKDNNLVNKNIIDFKAICDDKDTGEINAKKVVHIENILKNLPIYKDIEFENYNKHTEIDDVLDVDVELIKETLNSWEKTTFEVIDVMGKNEFSLDDIYGYKDIFSKKYPNNNTINASIRRNLQELRDLGLIKFLGNGKYKKLWERNFIL
ncbi:phospholipase D-like domain-containing protein [Clostridium sp. BJN0001]|uniref:phospholipase D-like domain-containing protein n=1 Tax=Clostridium sp. BJN0001 TaxID=2930219 RepID=UPI001FD2BFA9|nr:phospholipase D-like domain-containing protein [Clostridium sp. BJN0001]